MPQQSHEPTEAVHKMATKWKGSYDSSRKYKKSWEKQYPWLSESPDGKGSECCKLCRKSLQAKIWSISKHESSSEHTNRVKETQQMRPLAVERRTRPGAVKREIKEAETQIAVRIPVRKPNFFKILVQKMGKFGKFSLKHAN